MGQWNGAGAAWLQALRLVVAVAAFVFVTGGAPVSAATEDDGCWACEQCYPNENCIWCGSTVSFIVDSCCGNFVDGYAYCVGGHGFAVQCESGRQCMCDEEGGSCTSRTPRDE